MAEGAGLKQARDRRIVALSGLAPDIDVVAYAGALVWYGFDKDLAFKNVWEVIHHYYTHGIGYILLTGIVVYLLLRRPGSTGSSLAPATQDHALKVAGLAMIASMVHLFLDLVAGGPTWPIFPWWPISAEPWGVGWSYTLAQWPNTVVLVSLLVAMMFYPRLSGYSPLEAINYRLDAWFTHIVVHGSDHGATATLEADSTMVQANRSRYVRIIVYVALLVVCALILIPLAKDTGQLNLPGFIK